MTESLVKRLIDADHYPRPDQQWDRGDAVEVANGLAFAALGVTGALPIHHLEEYWLYHPDGIWRIMPKATLRGVVSAWAGTPIYAVDKNGEEKPKPLRINNTKAYVDELEAVCAREGCGDGTFDRAVAGVAFANGFLRVEGSRAQLVPLDADHLCRSGYGFDYAPVSEAPPMFASYLNSLWDVDQAARLELVQEWLGMAILGLSTQLHRALVLKGRKGSGKSTFIDILKGLLPIGDATGDEASVTPEQFGDDPYLYKLALAKINAVYEGEDRPIMDQARLRAVVSGETISINIKYKAMPLTTRIRCAHIFAYNDLPQVPGAHAAFWDRFIVLDLDRSVRGTSEEIEGLARKILDAERAQLVSWCIEGGLRALARGRYAIPASCEHQLKLWSGDADSVSAWLDDVAKVDPNWWTDLSTIYKNYRDWAVDAGMSPVNQRTFGRRLRHLDGVLERLCPATRRAQLSIALR